MLLQHSPSIFSLHLSLCLIRRENDRRGPAAQSYQLYSYQYTHSPFSFFLTCSPMPRPVRERTLALSHSRATFYYHLRFVNLIGSSLEGQRKKKKEKTKIFTLLSAQWAVWQSKAVLVKFQSLRMKEIHGQPEFDLCDCQSLEVFRKVP